MRRTKTLPRTHQETRMGFWARWTLDKQRLLPYAGATWLPHTAAKHAGETLSHAITSAQPATHAAGNKGHRLREPNGSLTRKCGRVFIYSPASCNSSAQGHRLREPSGSLTRKCGRVIKYSPAHRQTALLGEPSGSLQ